MPMRILRATVAGLALLMTLLAMTVQADNGEIRIERTTVQVGNPGSDDYAPVTVHAEGTTTHFCNAIFHDPEIGRSGDTVTVRLIVENIPFSSPGPHPACGTMTTSYSRDIDLGKLLQGEYTLTVNDFTMTFTVPGETSGDVISRRMLGAFAAFFSN